MAYLSPIIFFQEKNPVKIVIVPSQPKNLPMIKNILMSTTATLLLAALATQALAQTKAKSDEYLDFNPGSTTVGSEWVQAIVIKAPELRSEVKGDVKVEFQAPGMTVARALCWQQPTKDDPNPMGHDTLIGTQMKLDAEGNGSFVFPADQYPNGPITVRILANDDSNSKKDIRELQLFNKGGEVWNQGMPKNDPPAAQGMKLIFSDDFDKMPTISRDGQNATYCSHKPGGGDFSGWPFSDFEGEHNPFSQVGTFLRIHASKGANDKGSSGILSPVKADFTGVYATVPYYFECRFLAQSAPGTWPAFWTLTHGGTDGTDELDIVEAYGGVGKGNPNHPGYSITSHFWKQKDEAGKPLKSINKRVSMLDLGSKSYWSTTFHTYGLKVTETDTIYYLDDIEVLRHPTGPVSKAQPAFFMINYAIGGISGWKIHLEREGDASDMWVDYVRAYQGGK